MASSDWVKFKGAGNGGSGSGISGIVPIVSSDSQLASDEDEPSSSDELGLAVKSGNLLVDNDNDDDDDESASSRLLQPSVEIVQPSSRDAERDYLQLVNESQESSTEESKSSDKLVLKGNGASKPITPSPDASKPHVQFNGATLKPKSNGYNNSNGNKETSRGPSPSISSSSSSSEDNSSLDEARPPDGGWGWVVVAAAFMVNLIADGITFSFGVIFHEFLKYFGESKAATSWVGSLFMAMPLLSGPIASFLTDRYGCRKVTIAGSILATIGFVISYFANSMGVLILTFGVLAGFGLSLCFVAAVVIVAYYFDKRRSFATGLSVCGSGIGTFIFPPLIQKLLTEYGWRGATLILAGLFLNLAVCGCLMRDLEWTTVKLKENALERKRKRARKRQRVQSSSADSFSGSSSANTTQTGARNNNASDLAGGEAIPHDLVDPTENKLFSSLVSLPTFVRNGEKVPLEVLELLSNRKNVYNVLVQNYPSLLITSRSFSDSGGLYDQVAVDKNFVPSLSPLTAPGNTIAEEDARHEVFDENAQGDQNQLESPRRVHHHHHHQHHNDKEIAAAAAGGEPGTEGHNWWLRKFSPDAQLRHSIAGCEQPRRLPTAYLKDIRVHRHSLTYRGAMLNINRYRLRASSCPDIYRNSMTTIAKQKMVWYSGLWEFWDLLCDMLDFSHFADSRFLLFAISNFLLHTWYDVPYMYLIDNAVETGFDERKASLLISVIGIMNMAGEIILGWAGDCSWLNASVVYACCMALCGAFTALVPLVSHSYVLLSGAAGAFGFFIAANYSLTSIILVEAITLERFTNAYGLLLLVQGIANLMGPPLGGWLYDITGTYDLSFYLSGLFIALSGIMLLVMPLMDCYRRCKKSIVERRKRNEFSSV
ncbi:uncharacterized protein LOC106656306 [Trichogramma pretiosum]|uniref:uncharacterized protein LOC106656306 n=1 Tax=Trichogramma pretiosum TaxID=7493 RepID=UPI0006C9AE20|nr:uncharacterized protein LOC106656306 [Trichogramma pretiosum]XP_014232687.1 uncharacterized protein LOC106656306 [Trichogramma pretiosum]XP_014232688.1 uncharacterized protein LOC106656306 [Trichogramma pretiosum]